MMIRSVSFIFVFSSFSNLALSAGLWEDGRLTLNSRSLYFEHANREPAGSDQNQTDQGFILNFSSGYSSEGVGFGLDALMMAGVHLGGGIDHQNSNTSNTITPLDTDGSPVERWSRGAANLKIRAGASELKVGNALQPAFPVLVANDARVLPQTFGGAILTLKELSGLTLTAGRITDMSGRASTNSSGLAPSGGQKSSDEFIFWGADWHASDTLQLQYYRSRLTDYYSQDFFGLVHIFDFDNRGSLKTDLRYFRSGDNGRAGSEGYVYNNAGGFGDGKADNQTWSATLIYSIGGHGILVGYQEVSDSGAMVYVNGSHLRSGNGRPEGQGGASVYLYTDQMINSFIRAGEKTAYAQYSYDFAAMGVPGLKASAVYLEGRDILSQSGQGRRYSEWERDIRLDYVIQSGILKNLNFSLRRANYRTGVPVSQGAADADQTRLYVNYTYAFK